MLRTMGIVHFTLGVSDIDRSVEFYRDIIGLELLSKIPNRMAFMRSGKDHIVLARVPVNAEESPSVLHQAFVVESRDFDAGIEFLESRGVKIIGQDERQGDDAVFCGRSAYFRDPDGNVLEIIDLRTNAYRALQPSARAGAVGPS